MKPERAITAERSLARHCPELLKTDPAGDELVPLLTLLGARFSRAFAANLAVLSDRAGPAMECAAPRECVTADIADEIGPLAANSLLMAGVESCPVLASVEADEVLRMVDRAFGGKGLAPKPLPETFPVSAELMIDRLEALIARSIAQALGGDDRDAVRPVRRDGNLGRLSPFPEDERLMVLNFTVAEAQLDPWHLMLAFPCARLASLLGHRNACRTVRTQMHRALDPMADPASEVPLTLSAVLVDMSIPFSTLSRLEPGTVLPVAVARKVPLRIGDRTIGHGTIGEVDDRVAIQLSQAF